MRKYYILLENKRINDEKNKLEQLLNNRTAKQLFTRTINGNKLLFVKETGPEGTHEHKIDYSQRDTILSEIEETRSIRKQIHELSLHLRKIAPNIPKYKSEICKLYDSLCIKKYAQPGENQYKPAGLKYQSINGRFVRSKSESFIADALYVNRIHFEYESPVPIPGFHPDFYIKDNIRETPIIWEHFGMMGDQKYIQDVICKLKIYERYGFVLGYNLIATFEGYTNEKGEKEVFDPYKAESIVREWFLPDGIISF